MNLNGLSDSVAGVIEAQLNAVNAETLRVGQRLC